MLTLLLASCWSLRPGSRSLPVLTRYCSQINPVCSPTCLKCLCCLPITFQMESPAHKQICTIYFLLGHWGKILDCIFFHVRMSWILSYTVNVMQPFQGELIVNEKTGFFVFETGLVLSHFPESFSQHGLPLALYEGGRLFSSLPHWPFLTIDFIF